MLEGEEGGLGHLLPMVQLLQNTGGNFYIKDYNVSQPINQLLEDLDSYMRIQFIEDHRLVSDTGVINTKDGIKCTYITSIFKPGFIFFCLDR
ncbi:hypothetical protein E2C01_087892 [Portunus trituberculatus]|uniref:Uncharacterized protein n=1 Tax=Portunus trituberculatus TaxID=210409 RepID=A0A5B7JF99_PORTR|nr:hypothetical protein [Portunus trituberculatus]